MVQINVCSLFARICPYWSLDNSRRASKSLWLSNFQKFETRLLLKAQYISVELLEGRWVPFEDIWICFSFRYFHYFIQIRNKSVPLLEEERQCQI